MKFISIFLTTSAEYICIHMQIYEITIKKSKKRLNNSCYKNYFLFYLSDFVGPRHSVIAISCQKE